MDILFTLMLVFCAAAAISVFAMRESAFGMRLGVVQSESMAASDIHKGDVVFILCADEYDVGDVVVFYRASGKDYKQPFEDVDVSKNQIWVHQIISSKTDELGRDAYLTKGTSNAYNDGYFVPKDFVLGKAVRLPAFVGTIINFAASVRGIILLVILPCAVMIVYLVWELIMILTGRTEEPQT